MKPWMTPEEGDHFDDVVWCVVAVVRSRRPYVQTALTILDLFHKVVRRPYTPSLEEVRAALVVAVAQGDLRPSYPIGPEGGFVHRDAG